MAFNYQRAIVSLRDSKTGHVVIGALAGGAAVAVTLAANSLSSVPNTTVDGAIVAAVVPIVLLLARALDKYSQEELDVTRVVVAKGSVMVPPPPSAPLQAPSEPSLVK